MSDPTPRVSTPPIPIHRRPLTAREVVQAVAVVLTLAVVIASRFPASLTLLVQAGAVFGIEVTPAMLASTGGAFVVGCFVPGSPLGRVLDWIASFFGGPQVTFSLDDAQAAKAQLLPPPHRIPPSREGSASIGALDVVLALASLGALAWSVLRAWAPTALLALGLSGCGASALQMHGSGVAIAMLGVRGAEDAADAERRVTEDACQTEACLTAAVTARRPVVAAIDVTRAAVLAWRDAVAIAIDADAHGPDVLAALEVAVARVLARWADLAAALSTVGKRLPTLPPSIAALVPSGGA